ncbi:MAG: SIS domain-containing protein [Thermoplasmata archaeon]|nr:SIS domain-containing protein [Thermoplasmata archaeon]
MDFIKKYVDDLKKTISLVNENDIKSVINVLEKARETGKTIFTMGNGGSASTASHFVNGLSQGATVEGRSRFKAVGLTDNIPNMLAYANDLGYENIFVEQLKNLMKEGDIVIGISGSGNSPNVLKGIEYANTHNAVSIGFTGYDGGKLKKMVKYSIHVPCNFMEMVEDIHLATTHLIASYFRFTYQKK